MDAHQSRDYAFMFSPFDLEYLHIPINNPNTSEQPSSCEVIDGSRHRPDQTHAQEGLVQLSAQDVTVQDEPFPFTNIDCNLESYLYHPSSQNLPDPGRCVDSSLLALDIPPAVRTTDYSLHRTASYKGFDCQVSQYSGIDYHHYSEVPVTDGFMPVDKYPVEGGLYDLVPCHPTDSRDEEPESFPQATPKTTSVTASGSPQFCYLYGEPFMEMSEYCEHLRIHDPRFTRQESLKRHNESVCHLKLVRFACYSYVLGSFQIQSFCLR